MNLWSCDENPGRLRSKANLKFGSMRSEMDLRKGELKTSLTGLLTKYLLPNIQTHSMY
jgi:hypothetical protein